MKPTKHFRYLATKSQITLSINDGCGNTLQLQQWWKGPGGQGPYNDGDNGEWRNIEIVYNAKPAIAEQQRQKVDITFWLINYKTRDYRGPFDTPMDAKQYITTDIPEDEENSGYWYIESSTVGA